MNRYCMLISEAKVTNHHSLITKARVSNGIITVLHVGKNRNSTNMRAKIIDKSFQSNIDGSSHSQPIGQNETGLFPAS